MFKEGAYNHQARRIKEILIESLLILRDLKNKALL
jgi:hypothetical protein